MPHPFRLLGVIVPLPLSSSRTLIVTANHQPSDKPQEEPGEADGDPN